MGNVDQAFWVKGKKIIPVGTIHIRYILDNPELFNLTSEVLQDWYKQNNEKIGQEGKTREQVIKKVAEDGWIRVRHYMRPRDMWSIQTYDARRDKKSIDNFILWCLNEGVMGMNDELHILSYKDGSMKDYSFMDGGVRTYLYEKVQESDKLYETNINKLLEYNKKYDCGIITTFRKSKTYKENILSNKKLYNSMLSVGYRLIRVIGTYVYNDLSQEEIDQLRSGKKSITDLDIGNEISYFVIDIRNRRNLKKDLIFLGEEFNQDSIAFLPKGGGSMLIIGTNPSITERDENDEWPIKYKEEKTFSKLNLGRSNIFMTRVGKSKRPFFYESFEEIPLIDNPRAMAIISQGIDKKMHNRFIKNREINE